ncbi:MAG TPA: MFS transporter [Acidimicrobiales bacterium]|nr:MFS transporter [Acidimicrobiales bacterium]
MPASLRPLRHRDYALVWTSGMISNTGSWMQTVAVGSYVAATTHQRAWAALAFVAGFLPQGILSPIGGALADRLNRRIFLIVATICEAAVATALAILVVSGRATPGLVTGIVAVGGSLVALRLPFNQALLPDLVPHEDLLAAASLTAAQWNLGRVIGPTLAAGTIALWGYQWAFALNALSFGAVIIAMLLVRVPHRPPPVVERIWRRIADGARAANAEPGCRSAIMLMAIAAFLAAPFIALISARALELTDGTDKAVARATGVLTTAQGIGAVIGALVVAELAHRYSRRNLLLFDLVATPIALVFYGYAPNVATAAVALAVVGSLYIGILAGLQTTVQLRAPAEVRGRVLSIFLVSLGGLFPIGGVIQGWFGDRVGLGHTTAVACGLMLAVLAYIWTKRPHLFADLGDVGPDAISPIQIEEPVGLVPEPEPRVT